MESMGRWLDQVDPTPVFMRGAMLERWYRNHARKNELLWVVELRSGRLGTVAGRVVVSDDRATMDRFILANHVTGATIRKMDLPHGTRIHRLQIRR
jgi:hypothetical protein